MAWLPLAHEFMSAKSDAMRGTGALSGLSLPFVLARAGVGAVCLSVHRAEHGSVETCS